MAQVISFEERALARLRERLGEAVEANEDLIAFARGHWGAVASINAAVLATIEIRSVEALLDVVTREWPEILGIDFVAMAIRVGDCAFRADPNGIERVEPAFVGRILVPLHMVQVRSVECGHALFGLTTANEIRAEALVRIDGPGSCPSGVLGLGQRDRLSVECGHGSELLHYLGRVIAATARRCAAAG